MAKLFVSYSRRDSVAARRLIEAFRSIEHEVWVDWESIPPAVDWLEQIIRGIEEADAFLFLISPDSIASEVCKVEITRAAQNNKRIIPIVLRDVNHADAPEAIRRLNWTFLRESDDFQQGLSKVKTAIELDLDWLEEHRRLQVRALEWHRKKDTSLLLHGRDLRNASRMVETATSKDPTPTELQKTYILHSQRNERNRTIAWTATIAALIIMMVLSYAAWRNSILANRNADLYREQKVIADQKADEALRNEQEARKQEAAAVKARQEAEEARDLARQNETEAEAQRSAARAQIYLNSPGELFISTLLAIDSLRRDPSQEMEEILRTNISRLPLPLAQAAQGGRINALALNPDRDILITGSADGTACAWRIEERLRKIFCTEAGPSVNAVAFSPDGSVLAVGDQSGLLQLLEPDGTLLHAYRRTRTPQNVLELVDVRDGSAPQEATDQAAVRGISFRPPRGGQVAVAYEDGEIPVFDPLTGKVSSPLWTGYRPNVAGFSPNGSWLVVGSENGIVSIWNLSNPAERFPRFDHRGGVLAIAFHPRESTLVSGGNDNTAAMISLRGKELLFRIPNQNSVRDLAFNQDGSWLVTASDRRVRVWDALSGEEQVSMSHEALVTDIALSSNSRWIASTAEDRTVRVWDALTGAELFQIPLDAPGARLAFGGDDRWLVATDERGAIQVWDLSVMQTTERSLQVEGAVRNVQYSPSGRWLAISAEDKVWLLTPEPQSILKEREPGAPIHDFNSRIKSLAFSPDENFLAMITEEDEVALYDIRQRDLKTLLASGAVRSVQFSSDGQLLIAIAADGSLQSWRVSDGKPAEDGSAEIVQAPSLDQEGGLQVLSPDGSLLAAVDSAGTIRILQIEADGFSEVAAFRKDQVASMAFNPQGTLLAVGTARNASLLDVAGGEEIARIPHSAMVNGVSFSTDGTYLVTASGRVLQFWDVAGIEPIRSSDLIQTACARMFRNLSLAQWETLFPGEKYEALCDGLPTPQ